MHAHSCLTLRDPRDCSPPGSSVHGILQARILKGLSLSCVQLCVSPWTVPARLLFPWKSPGKNTGVGGLSLLQSIFLTQEDRERQSQTEHLWARVCLGWVGILLFTVAVVYSVGPRQGIVKLVPYFTRRCSCVVAGVYFFLITSLGLLVID